MLCLWLGFTEGGGWFGVSRELLITQPPRPRPLSLSLSEKSCDFRIPILGRRSTGWSAASGAQTLWGPHHRTASSHGKCLQPASLRSALFTPNAGGGDGSSLEGSHQEEGAILNKQDW